MRGQSIFNVCVKTISYDVAMDTSDPAELKGTAGTAPNNAL